MIGVQLTSDTCDSGEKTLDTLNEKEQHNNDTHRMSQAAWASALVKYAGVSKADVRDLAAKLDTLPVPQPEAVSFLSHDLLEDLGVTAAADRANVILAAARAPAPETDSHREDDDRAVAALQVNAPASYSEETAEVRVTRCSPPDGRFAWIDVSGQDVPSNPKSEAFFASAFAAQCCKVQAELHPTAAPLDKCAADKKELWSVVFAQKPLPFLLKDRATRSGALVLRICTLGVDSGGGSNEVTMSSLTNRLIVYVNADTKKIATMHRADTKTLAHLRETLGEAVNGEAAGAEPEEDAADFASTLVSIFMCFLSEFVLALDESKALLDYCEQNIMDNKRAKEFLDQLHHLSRRASVYQRMLELNERVIKDACDYFDVEGEAVVLQPRWEALREECQALSDRSLNALNLIISLSGYRTSDAVAVLTKISGARAPATFIAGYYGQNWERLPEIAYTYGYFVSTLVQIVVFVAMLLYLKSKGL